MDKESAEAFARETWAMYGVGAVTVVLRYVSRIRRFGWQGLKFDDYVMLNGFFWYTMLCVSLNKIASGGGSNLITDEELATLTEEEKQDRIAGSKWVFVSEHCILLAIWSMKICMLVLYTTITDGVKARKYFNWLGIFIGLGFVGSELALFLICRPIQQYWALPPNNAQCYNYGHYEIVQGCFSIPADIAMLLIAIPIIMGLRVSLQQKAILLLIFGMGGFVIVSSILTKLYCLVPELISYVYMNWYFREASVAVYVTNLPLIWPLVKDLGTRLGLSIASQSQKYGYGSRSGPERSGRNHLNSNSHVRMDDKNTEMDTFSRSAKNGHATVKGMGGPGESQEHITGDSSSDQQSGSFEEHRAIEIKREVTYTVESMPADSLAERGEWDFGIGDPVVTAGRRSRQDMGAAIRKR